MGFLLCMTRMGRSVQAATLIRAQADFFFPIGTFNRVPSLSSSSLTADLFVNNLKLNWLLYDGSATTDISISSGKIYFNEISGSPGFYSIRFYPDRIGFWRLILRNSSLGTETVIELDVSSSNSQSSGLQATFT